MKWISTISGSGTLELNTLYNPVVMPSKLPLKNFLLHTVVHLNGRSPHETR